MSARLPEYLTPSWPDSIHQCVMVLGTQVTEPTVGLSLLLSSLPHNVGTSGMFRYFTPLLVFYILSCQRLQYTAFPRHRVTR